MAKFKYKLKFTSNLNKNIIRLAKTKKEAEKVKSNMIKANMLNKEVGFKPRFKNIRILKNR